MSNPPADYFDRVCEALAPRCGGGQETVAALGRPADSACYERWVAAGLLSAVEAVRLQHQETSPAPELIVIKELLGITAGLPEMVSEWGWDFTESQRTVNERPPPSVQSSSAGWSWSEIDVDVSSIVEYQPIDARRDRFLIGERIIQTRFFNVFRARDLMLGRDVVAHARRIDGPLSREEFIAAVRVQASLQHANIQPVYEITEQADNGIFYATSLNLERSLARVFRWVVAEPERRLEWSMLRRLEILLDVARAIAFAHRRGIYHRDLRPRQIRLGNFGEVHVAGWFRSRQKSVPVDEARDALVNMVDSGLGYLAPERLEHGLSRCGVPADVWGLGAMLYATLTLRPPLAGRSSSEMLNQLKENEMVPPSERVRHQTEIPEPLEKLCMEALVIDPDRRRLSAEEFATELEDFLDGTRTEERRIEQAEEQLEDARHAAKKYLIARARLDALDQADRDEVVQGRKPAPHRAQQVTARTLDLNRWFHRADEAYGLTLGTMPHFEPARFGLCGLYFNALQDCERGRLSLPERYLAATIRLLDPGPFSQALQGKTHLEVHTEPSGYSVRFHQFIDDDGERQPDEGRLVGTTPFAMANLRPGDYLLTLSTDTISVRLSVSLTRGERQVLHLNLPKSTPKGLIFIPGGPFSVGVMGEGRVVQDALPPGRCDLGGYFIGEDLVSLRDYQPFLQALHTLDPEQAAQRAPRDYAETVPHWQPSTAGYTLPFTTPDGLVWTADNPVCGITVEDAEAYIAWRSEQDDLTYRLPTELEWAKAARGASGRLYPWGARPDPGLCHTLDSDETPRTLRPLRALPSDRSVYGVWDMAGMAREYTASMVDGNRVARGGSWLLPFSECSSVIRAHVTAVSPLFAFGFRMALDGPAPREEPLQLTGLPDWPSPSLDSSPTPSMKGFLAEELTVMGRSVLLTEFKGRTAEHRGHPTSTLNTAPTRYVLLEEIARGSMGRVVLAYDDVLQRHVALKILHEKHQEDRLSIYRFVMEARITSRLQHTTMVPIYDVGRMESGERFFAMRPIEGLSLHEVLRARAKGDRRTLGDYNRDRLLTVLRRVCQGVAFAHQHGVVHRDLKPANIIVGDFGEVAIVDLGLARQLKPDDSDRSDVEEMSMLIRSDGRVTRVGSVIGTPYYMSPEQAMGLQDSVGPNSDVYGLGAILYHILTNRPPFSGKKVNEVLAKVRAGNPLPPSHIAPDQDVPKVLDEIVLRALSMKPEDRQNGALAFAAELRAFQESMRLRAQQQQIAELRASRTVDAFDAYDGLIVLLNEHRRRFRRLRKESKSERPPVRRRMIWRAMEQISRQTDQVEAQVAVMVRLARLALASDPRSTVRDRLITLLKARHVRAEKDREADALSYYGHLLRTFDTDGELARWLHDGATVRLRTSPPRLPSALYRYEPDEARLAKRVLMRGPTPLHTERVAVGSGIATLSARGQKLRIPFYVERNLPVELEVEWPTIQPGFAIVWAGRFAYGGDASTDHGARTASLPTFQIGVHPITCNEYAIFLDDLAQVEPESVARRRPMLGPNGPDLWEDKNPFGPNEGERPVTGLRLADAHAYTQWRSRRDNIHYRLPTSAEWEKAARGIDGRLWPWGPTLDAEVLRAGRGRLPSVGENPEDCSPYGVQELATGVFEWTLTSAREGSNICFIRGGCSALPLHGPVATLRQPWPPDVPSPYIGFRLVIEPS